MNSEGPGEVTDAQAHSILHCPMNDVSLAQRSSYIYFVTRVCISANPTSQELRPPHQTMVAVLNTALRFKRMFVYKVKMY